MHPTQANTVIKLIKRFNELNERLYYYEFVICFAMSSIN